MGYRLWSRRESGMTEQAHMHPILRVLPAGAQVTIITSQRPPSLNTITLYVRASTYAFWKDFQAITSVVLVLG